MSRDAFSISSSKELLHLQPSPASQRTHAVKAELIPKTPIPTKANPKQAFLL